MPIPVTVSRLSTSESQGGGPNEPALIDQAPNVCPICHVTIEPEFLSGTPIACAFNWLEIYYRCTNKKCRRHFTALYAYRGTGAGSGAHAFDYVQSLPTVPMAPVFDETINDLSPDFVKVYAEAQAAESHNLMEIAGPGYRKALEFLIKDYAIYLNPNEAASIKAMFLGNVITKYLPGDKLTVVSTRAAWLGNDQTHYERRWIGKDLQDLKKLIGATVHFMAMERLAADLPTDMPA